MKNIRSLFLSAVASVVTLVAYSEASTASMWLFYQPKVPKELQK